MPSTDDRILDALATGPRTGAELAALAGLHDWRDALDPIAHLSRAGLVTRATPNPGRNAPGTTLRYQLTRAGKAAALDLAADPVVEPGPAAARVAAWREQTRRGVVPPRRSGRPPEPMPVDELHEQRRALDADRYSALPLF